jgi:hypothetical protein
VVESLTRREASLLLDLTFAQLAAPGLSPGSGLVSPPPDFILSLSDLSGSKWFWPPRREAFGRPPGLAFPLDPAAGISVSRACVLSSASRAPLVFSIERSSVRPSQLPLTLSSLIFLCPVFPRACFFLLA